MTCSGLASLIIARHHLGQKQPTLDPSVLNGLEWLAENFTVERNPHESTNHYYYLYGIERAGVLAGTEFFGDQEWYPIGARYLLSQQSGDGHWNSKNGPSTGSYQDYLDTSYAILFLRRATLSIDPEKFVKPKLVAKPTPTTPPPLPATPPLEIEKPKPAFLRVTYKPTELPPDLWPSVHLILDSSGSMSEIVEGRAKHDIAREVMTTLFKEIPDHMQVGLRLYGHWGQWLLRRDNPQAALISGEDPRLDTDSQLVVSIAPLTTERKASIESWLKWTQPRGKTPMVYSLLQAKNDFTSKQRGAKTIILISDGVETCGGKIEDVGKAYRDSGIDIVVHVVGFDIRDTVAQKQLAEIARLGGGLYFAATNAKQLAAALKTAVATSYEVSNETGGKQVVRGTVNGDPVSLPAGRYQVRLTGSPAKPINVQLEPGQTLEISIQETGEKQTPILLKAVAGPVTPKQADELLDKARTERGRKKRKSAAPTGDKP